VSWLPLYHDMGFIACLVLPLALNIPAVLMDPMHWIADPARLVHAIVRHGGTTCWMPNFGFEVLARQAVCQAPTMRRWISCSEPSRADTLERFCAATGASHEIVSTCYAMAENVFAVSQSVGLVTRQRDGRRHVSCGRLLPDTAVKIVDGEIFVKSPSSVQSYVGTPDVRDADGFYGTGDLGWLLDDELFVAGRKHDVLVTAGQKFLLSDLDQQLNAVSGCNGRGVALADDDPRLPGTNVATCLVERVDFWDLRDHAALQRTLSETTGLNALNLHYVPPAFITKTSSGKVNRVGTLTDWRACRGGRGSTTVAESPLREVLGGMFADLPTDVPLGELLDSLGTVAMQLLFEEHGLSWNPAASLDEATWSRSAEGPSAHREVDGVISLVLLADRDPLSWVDDAFAAELAEAAGAPVRIEPVCAPPSFALLSDLIFHDYFMVRDTARDYRAFAACVRRVKQASLLVVDDVVEHWFPSQGLVYPVLSHRFERADAADRMGFRWTPYIANHHRLPVRTVDQDDHPAATRARDLARLSDYLQVPIFRRATVGRFDQWTRDWESRALRNDEDVRRSVGYDTTSFRRSLLAFVSRRAASLKRIPGPPESGVAHRGDRPHFCSNIVRPDAIDFLVRLPYHSYVISGIPASVPGLARALRAQGKSVRYARTLKVGDGPVDCVIQAGTWGVPDTTAPVFELMNAIPGGRARPINVPDHVAAAWPGWKLSEVEAA
jgi:hypothetical protein